MPARDTWGVIKGWVVDVCEIVDVPDVVDVPEVLAAGAGGLVISAVG
jgi:hypothetical protein